MGLGLGVGVRDGDRVRCPARSVPAVLDAHTQLDQSSVAQLVARPHQGGGALGRGTHLVRVGLRLRIRGGLRPRVRVRVRVGVRVRVRVGGFGFGVSGARLVVEDKAALLTDSCSTY